MIDVQIAAATNVSPGGRGEYPVRYVVLKWLRNAHPFSRHMQVIDGKNDQYFVYGHYYCTFEDAYEDMIKTMKDNNKNYPNGNISHLPGIDVSVDGYFYRGVWISHSEANFPKNCVIVSDIHCPYTERGYFFKGRWVSY